jgi:energy-coupling factor transporter ATP-binding protein EcfA2
MFKSMRLKNFKAYKDSGEIPLAPLTVIIGANNSGKSTLFHALLALVQTAQDAEQGGAPRLVTKGLVDLNGFHDVLYGKNPTKTSTFEISIGMTAIVARARTLTGGLIKNGEKFTVPDRAEIAFGWNDAGNEIGVQRSTLLLDGVPVISVERRQGEWLFTAPLEAPEGAEAEFIGVFPCFSMPMVDQWQQFMNAGRIADFRAAIWASIFKKQISHIGPLRVRVPWYASIGARTSSEFGLGGENLVADLGSKEKDPQTKKTRLELVNDWLATREVLKSVHIEMDKSTSGRMLLGDEWHGPTRINIAGMGEGVSQILPIIAYTLFGPVDWNEDCLLVEQPEIHLHPRLQAELGDLFIEVAQRGNRQVLVETHSEHLVLRLRRRIAEGKVKPDQVAILFVEKQAGESKVRRLDLNTRGHFSDWPKDFFDDAYQEAMALATAASRKGYGSGVRRTQMAGKSRGA